MAVCLEVRNGLSGVFTVKEWMEAMNHDNTKDRALKAYCFAFEYIIPNIQNIHMRHWKMEDYVNYNYCHETGVQLAYRFVEIKNDSKKEMSLSELYQRCWKRHLKKIRRMASRKCTEYPITSRFRAWSLTQPREMQQFYLTRRDQTLIQIVSDIRKEEKKRNPCSYKIPNPLVGYQHLSPLLK